MRCRLALYTSTLLCPLLLSAQTSGSIEGKAILAQSGEPLHGATILVVELGKTAITGSDGRYRFENVAPGRYHLLAHLDSLFTEERKTVRVPAGQTANADFELELAARRYEITVSARGAEQTTLESFQSVTSLDSYDLAEEANVSLGEVLDNRVGTGIAKRSFGPGSSRPIIRGFDGDRVLVMQDGIPTGTLSSQSGDHGEVLNVQQLDRLEVVKGPSTLLYGSSALGGVVNAISRHHAVHQHPHQGLRGFVSGSGGSGNALGGGNAGFEFGFGDWMIWGGGGGMRTGDYHTPAGQIFNSRSRIRNANGGIGRYGEKTFFSFGVQTDDGSYGVPFAQELAHHGEGEEEEEEEELDRVSLDSRREAYQVDWGIRDLGSWLDNFHLKLNLTKWSHDEVEFFKGGEREIGTQFDQDQFIYRGVFEQNRRGPLGGRFGFWGLVRDYDVAGEEALAPPVDHTAFAVFGLEELEFEHVKFQFGGRVERNRYQPVQSKLPERSFTGGSAAAGIHADLWRGGAFVANYAHSYRAPALEELYNNGPHVGNLAFEVGQADLLAETGDGIDLSLRHQSERLRAELNVFYYTFNNFVFPLATGEVEDGLRVIEFTQRDSRFAGSEARLDLGLRPGVWVTLGADFVDAQETNQNTPLPRIPPLRGRLGFDLRQGNFNFKPELVLASSQHQTFTDETRTAGYAVVNLKASYTIPQRHFAHQFSVEVFNVGDRLYRNHSSLIKDLAPEIGRGVRFTYMVRLF